MRGSRTTVRETAADASVERKGLRSRGVAARLLVALLAAVAALALGTGAAQATEGPYERPNGSLEATCNSVTYHFKGFPAANGNVVFEKVTFKQNLTPTVLYEGNFEFNGPEGSNTITFPKIPPGPSGLDGLASWNTNGFKGGFDILYPINCSFPGYTIEKLQRIQGSGGPFTKETLLGEVGDVIEYEIPVTDTGNTKLKLEKFEDKHCTGISGPTELQPGETGIFTCSHAIVPADLSASVYSNQATVTATPPKGQGGAKTKKSNIVSVKLGREGSRENGEEEATCNSLTFRFFKFPNAPNNTVTEKITVTNKAMGKVFTQTVIFKFTGPTGENTVKIFHPPGYAIVDGFVSWNTNGFKGAFDIGHEVFCPANPAFSATKLQKIEGTTEPFTAGTIVAFPGQTIAYEIEATNEGNTPLTFTTPSDPNCEGIAGGPVGPVEHGQSTTWTCKHVIASQDVGHVYSNTAEVTGSYEGNPTTHMTNTVEAIVEL
jgi:hypothetical protein